MKTKFNTKKRLSDIWKRLRKPPKHAPFYTMFVRKPETARNWTTIYYGSRGSGKTLHQAKEMMKILRWLKKLYAKRPQLKKAIVFTNQNVSQDVREKYKEFLYFWNECEDFKYCPRKKCWRGKERHLLHGCYLIFDDVSIILDARNWPILPDWLKKYFVLGRHFGIHCLASLVNASDVDVAFRRTVDVAFQFTKIVGSPDPDETQPAIKRIFGVYRRRKIDAKTLWRQGDLPEQEIRLMMLARKEMEENLKEQGKEMDIVDDESWKGSYHLFNATGNFWPFGYIFPPIASTRIYDTLQNVKEFVPRGLLANDIRCIDPSHVHLWDAEFQGRTLSDEEIKEIQKRPNFCKYVKRSYDVV